MKKSQTASAWEQMMRCCFSSLSLCFPLRCWVHYRPASLVLNKMVWSVWIKLTRTSNEQLQIISHSQTAKLLQVCKASQNKRYFSQDFFSAFVVKNIFWTKSDEGDRNSLQHRSMSGFLVDFSPLSFLLLFDIFINTHKLLSPQSCILFCGE